MAVTRVTSTTASAGRVPTVRTCYSFSADSKVTVTINGLFISTKDSVTGAETRLHVRVGDGTLFNALIDFIGLTYIYSDCADKHETLARIAGAMGLSYPSQPEA